MGTSFSYPSIAAYSSDAGGSNFGTIILPPIHFDSSLTINYYYFGTSQTVTGYAIVKLD